LQPGQTTSPLYKRETATITTAFDPFINPLFRIALGMHKGMKKLLDFISALPYLS
jgi:hypothetical protein